MALKNEMPRFPYPVRGLSILAVFLVIAPPVQVVAEVFMQHAWVGGRQLLIEIVNVFQQNALPKILSGYSIYMPAVFIAGLWSGLGPARGAGLTLGGAIGHMIIAGLVLEFVYQAVVISFGGPFVGENVMVGLVQWIFSGWISWIVATWFRLDKPVQQ